MFAHSRMMLPVLGGISGSNKITWYMPTAPETPAAPLALDFLGLRFNSPIVLLSGCVGFGEEYTRVEGFSNREVGAIVLKGTTLKPRLGNPPHRVYETPMGMLNAIGLQNPGADHVVQRILPQLDFDGDALHCERMRLDDRGVRRGHASVR